MVGFLDVVLRGLMLCAQAVVVGGSFYALWVLRPAGPLRFEVLALQGRTFRLIAAGAAGLGAAQATALALQLSALADGGPWPWRLAMETVYFKISVARMLVSAAIIAAVVAGRALGGGARLGVAALALGLPLLSAGISHAAARLDHRATLLLLDAFHQLVASIWVGGLLHLVATAVGRRGAGLPAVILPRFSAMALVAVAVLVLTGAGLSLGYIDGVGAVFGTAYGVMVATKIVLLGGLLLLGAMNFLAVRGPGVAGPLSALRLRRFVEVELGLGLTVLFAAASLTSLPPSVDVVADRATFAEVATRFTPRLPTFTSPRIEEMPVDDPSAPRTDADRAWSEYNHHVAGVFVLTMGLLAILHRTGRAPWARHWPLVFLGMAAFLLVRNDPGAWPLGPQGFWESMREPSVLQHRIFTLIVVAFGIFEWLVRTGKLTARPAALIFPLVSAVGGALLLTHSHASLNLKSEFLIEVTHVPLAVLSLLVGWGRWLELRLPPLDDRVAGRLWASAFAMIGVLLILYRES